MFHITKEINEADMSETVEVTVWVEKPQLKIYGVYCPPNNKNLNLGTLHIRNDMIILGVCSAASTTWGNSYQNHLGKTVE
jgi:hypothetical protein